MDANSPLDRAGAPLRCPVNTDGHCFFPRCPAGAQHGYPRCQDGDSAPLVLGCPANTDGHCLFPRCPAGAQPSGFRQCHRSAGHRHT